VFSLPARIELYRGQYTKHLPEVGPGIAVALQTKGVSEGDLRAGDVLYL
jgi:hypothetical protein